MIHHKIGYAVHFTIIFWKVHFLHALVLGHVCEPARGGAQTTKDQATLTGLTKDEATVTLSPRN